MRISLLILFACLFVLANASEPQFFDNPNLLGLTSSFCSLPDFLELLLAAKTIYDQRHALLKAYLGDDAEKCFGDAEIPAEKFFPLCRSILSDENIAFSELTVHRRGDDFEVKIWDPTASMCFAFNAILSREVKLSSRGTDNTVGAILVPSDFPFFLQTSKGTHTLSSFYYFGKFRFVFKPPASFSWIGRNFDFGDQLEQGVRLGKMEEAWNFPVEITHEIPLKMALFILSKAGDWRQAEKREPAFLTGLNSATEDLEYQPSFAENLRNCNQQAQAADNKRKHGVSLSTKLSPAKLAKSSELLLAKNI